MREEPTHEENTTPDDIGNNDGHTTIRTSGPPDHYGAEDGGLLPVLFVLFLIFIAGRAIGVW